MSTIANRLPPLPSVGPICYASAMDVLLYKQAPEVGSHLPGVRDVALWSTDQLRAYALSAIAALQAQIAELEARQVPIDMVLHCPACGLQHIDAPEELPMGLPGGFTEGSAGWANQPHRSHLCHGCGHIWRPADVPTNGVAAVKTRGKNDSGATAAVPSNPTTQPPEGR